MGFSLGAQRQAASQGSFNGCEGFQNLVEERDHNRVTVSLVTTRSKIWQFSKLSVLQDNQKHIFT